MKKALITGITGQDGYYLSQLLLEKGYDVHGLVRRSSTPNTSRLAHHLSSLVLHYGDVTDGIAMGALISQIKPNEVYNLAAQSHVRISFDTPAYTFNVVADGALNLLEAIRRWCPSAHFYQASSSEMFGLVQETPQTEKTPFYPRSPYGCAKLAAHWLTKNYRESYGLHASSGILFNHECVTSQTPVIVRINNMIDVIPIEELVPHRENPKHGTKYQTIADGIEVWDGNRWSRVTLMTATWNPGDRTTGKQVYAVHGRGCYYAATADHISFLTGKKEIPTSELKSGDTLELGSLPMGTNITTMTHDEAEFLGMIVADGYISKDGAVRFTKNDHHLRDRVLLLWQKITGGCGRESSNRGGFESSGNVFCINLSAGRDYAKFIRSQIYTESGYKRIPSRILNADDGVKDAFLRGYNVCDGLKGGHQTTEFKSFTTNSQTLAAGLWMLCHGKGYRTTLHTECRDEHTYFHININSDRKGHKGAWLRKPLDEIKKITNAPYTGWLFDLATESGTFSAGVGFSWVHNSPLRGENFVTRKISMAAAAIKMGRQTSFSLGNVKAMRDWGYAGDYARAMWLMLQQDQPDDYVIATGELHSVEEFADEAFSQVGLKWKDHCRFDANLLRPAEVELLVGDSTKARYKLGWRPDVSFGQLAVTMVEHDLNLLKI